MVQLKTILRLSAEIVLVTLTLVQCSLTEPCSFSDTVDLSGSQKLPNGDYVYENTRIPANLVSDYDYEVDGILSKRIPVKRHPRGCICKLKSCVRFCCPLGQRYYESKCLPFHGDLDDNMNITTKNGESSDKHVLQEFAVQIGRPCVDMYYLDPDNFVADEFELFENGTLYRLSDKAYMPKDEYCIGSVSYTDSPKDYLVVFNCYLKSDNTKTSLYSYTMLFSVPFMILTIIVYIAVPELRRTLHGKALCCYLLGLCFGYTILSLFNLWPETQTYSQFHCSFWGYVAYFSFMASFFWVSVISFDLYNNINAQCRQFNENKQFIPYSIYAWGMASIFLGITYFAQQSSLVYDDWKPGIGSDQYCFLKITTWSALAYFYAPIIIIIGFNITMFILTARQINNVQKEMTRMMESKESKRNLRKEEDRYKIFLRLFIVMGVTWSMEIISYLVGQKFVIDKIFYITDVCNGIQGFIIFTLFVLKKKVKKYMYKAMGISK